MSEPQDDGRYGRQILLFGHEGQAKLEAARVAVLGLGGLGSHVCQQLAYLGVQHYVLVDDDPIDHTNLNRLIGATPEDVGTQKSAVAERTIRQQQPAADIEIINEKLPSNAAAAAIGQVDVVVGCFDGDWPRLMTTQHASEAGTPYIDTATDIEVGEDGRVFYGGHVLVCGTEPGCLSCLGMLDQTAIRREQMTAEELAAEAKIYGVPVEALRGTGPSVVTLNGVIASLATTELMALITGLSIGKKLQYFRGELHRISASNDTPEADCYYCNQWLIRGRG